MATVILQARMGSTRLPGKVLKPIMGKPMLYYTVATLKQSPVVDRIVLATTNTITDDPLVDFAKNQKIDYFRGYEEDVLGRFYLAAAQFNDRYYLRATGDNPILDYHNPGRTLNHLIQHKVQYCMEKGMPVGTVIEAFTFDALKKCHVRADKSVDREHVTLYMKREPEFKASFLSPPGKFYYPEINLTVDCPEDFEKVKRIITSLYKNGIPSFETIINYLVRK